MPDLGGPRAGKDVVRGVGRAVIVVVALCSGIVLTGCTAAADDDPAPTQTEWTIQPSPGATSSGATFAAKGTAAQNRGAFDAAIQNVIGKNPKATGQQVAAALEAAGFAKSSLQFSASKTSVDLVPGSILVSAQLGTQCLIGQWGTAVGGYHSAIAPALNSGGCLVGGGGIGVTPSKGAGSLGD